MQALKINNDNPKELAKRINAMKWLVSRFDITNEKAHYVYRLAETHTRQELQNIYHLALNTSRSGYASSDVYTAMAYQKEYQPEKED